MIKLQLHPTISTWVDVLNLATRYLDQSATFIFSASEMGHWLDPFQELGDSRGDAQKNWNLAFNPSQVSPCLLV
jgi:hypothetical protein